MARLNVMKTIEKSKGKIDVHYDLYAKHIREIEENSGNYIALLYNMFRFGYMQGVKSQKAKSRKGIV